MAEGTEMIFNWFPKLKKDRNFAVTSPDTRNYNCIAWAMGHKDLWVWPVSSDKRDDDMLWSNELGYSQDIESFQLFFKSQGFESCNNLHYDPEYTKVALYSQNGECTHAARQLSDGLWTSKLGPWHDIQHSSPYSLEGNIYGKVAYVLRRKIA